MAKRYTTVSEVLAAALEKFGPKGERWIKYSEHQIVDGEDTYCMLGAVKATTRGKLRDEALNTLTGVIHEHGYSSIPMCNDAGVTRFPTIKKLMCSAVNTALKEEGKEATHDA